MLPLLALFGAGIVAGTLNVIAGGGSFLTLPLMIFLGIPAVTANGTNRLAILTQNVGAVWRFDRLQLLDRATGLRIAAAMTLGAGAGTLLALHTPEEAFRRVLAALMVGVTLWTFFASSGQTTTDGPTDLRFHHWLIWIGIGVYAGFVQAGVGFLILAATTAQGRDFVRGNAIKVLGVLCSTVLSLALFATAGKIAWLPGLALAAGTTIGGQLGVHLTVLKGNRWVKSFVTVMVLIFAVRLLVG